MWIGVLWAGLRVAMWIPHVGGEFRHGLLKKSLEGTNFRCVSSSMAGHYPGANLVHIWLRLICHF